MSQSYIKTILVIFLLVSFQTSFATTKLAANNIVVISSQQELEAFGKQKLSKFSGSLIIENASDLTPLTTLVEIEGMLVIGDHTPDGIVQNPELRSLKGLENLKKIGRHLSFHSNPKLENLDALQNLTSIGESLDIMNNKSLVSIKGLDNVTFIGKSLNIWKNPKLKTIDIFYKITKVNGRLSVYDNDSLQDISGFSNIQEIGGELMIQENDALTELNGFDALETIQKRFELKNNYYLLRINAFVKLKSVGFMQMRNNTRLQSICGFRSLKIVKDASEIVYNGTKFTIVNGMFDLSDCK